MKMIIAWWDLRNSTQTIHSLHEHLSAEDLLPWESVEGLRLKIWISDSVNNLWGAVMLWESETFMKQTLPPNKATELIGYPPTLRHCFDIEAITEGQSTLEVLNHLGLCFNKNITT